MNKKIIITIIFIGISNQIYTAETQNGQLALPFEVPIWALKKYLQEASTLEETYAALNAINDQYEASQQPIFSKEQKELISAQTSEEGQLAVISKLTRLQADRRVELFNLLQRAAEKIELFEKIEAFNDYLLSLLKSDFYAHIKEKLSKPYGTITPRAKPVQGLDYLPGDPEE